MKKSYYIGFDKAEDAIRFILDSPVKAYFRFRMGIFENMNELAADVLEDIKDAAVCILKVVFGCVRMALWMAALAAFPVTKAFSLMRLRRFLRQNMDVVNEVIAEERAGTGAFDGDSKEGCMSNANQDRYSNSETIDEQYQRIAHEFGRRYAFALRNYISAEHNTYGLEKELERVSECEQLLFSEVSPNTVLDVAANGYETRLSNDIEKGTVSPQDTGEIYRRMKAWLVGNGTIQKE